MKAIPDHKTIGNRFQFPSFCHRVKSNTGIEREKVEHCQNIDLDLTRQKRKLGKIIKFWGNDGLFDKLIVLMSP